MAYLPLRSVSLPAEVSRGYDGWLERLQDRLAESGADWNRIARDVLYELWYPGFGDYDERLGDPRTSDTARLALLGLDPRNITLEPEYYADVDQARFARVKPLL